MANSNNNSHFIEPDYEQVTLVTSNVPVKHVLGVYHVDVPMGEQHRLFKNGRFDQDLTPGSHTWTNLNPLVRYTLSKVDTRVHTSKPIIARGTIPGQHGASGEPDMPPCHVEVPLQLTYQLADIDKLLQTDKPLKRLELITLDQIATQIGQLRYGEVGKWPTQLRDEIQRWLRINAAGRTGLQVLEVLIIGEPRGQNDADRLLLKKFVTIQEVDIERIRQDADRENQVKDARTSANVADIVGLPTGEVAMAQLEGLDKLLDAHVRLTESRINAGDWGGARTIAPEPPHQGQLAAPGMGAGGDPAADAPKRISPPLPPEMSGFGGPPSGTSGTSGTYSAASSPSGATSGTLDRDRIDAECNLLLQQGYQIHRGDAQVTDAQGQASYGYKVTVMPDDPDTSSWQFVQFELGAGYPQTAPIVWLRRSGVAPARWNGPILHQWTSLIRLSDVMTEALKTV